MIATPFGDSDVAHCRPSPGSLGSAFTHVALSHGGNTVTINVADIRAGDVILYSHRSSTNRHKNPVYRYQRRLFADEAARWTHCAILDENLTVWDAMPSADVRSRPLREVLREPHHLQIVRPGIAPDPIGLRISLLQFSNHGYKIFTVATLGRLGARLARSGAWTNPAADDNTVMCSLFVANVLRRSTKHSYFRHLPIVIPADFATDVAFSKIPLFWRFAEP